MRKVRVLEFDGIQQLIKPQIGFCVEIFYHIATSMSKISILLFYRRLTSRASETFLRIVWVMIAVFVSTLISICVASFLICRPFSATWVVVNPFWALQNKGKYQCFDEGALFVAGSALSMAQDFIVCVMPLPVIWTLNISMRQKIALICIFGAGLLYVASPVVVPTMLTSSSQLVHVRRASTHCHNRDILPHVRLYLGRMVCVSMGYDRAASLRGHRFTTGLESLLPPYIPRDSFGKLFEEYVSQTWR